jgi:glycosyltransferase involved in cell wall biosynthesis
MHAQEVSISKPVYQGEKGVLPIVLVSVGLPVRNGARTLRYALDSIINQDYRNLEIIISDNNSTDDTALIALEYQKRDNRITYHRQPRFLTALENFRFVLDEARGDYFMWAAHDDTRSGDYVSVLLRAMQIDPGPILGFGDLCTTDSIKSEGRVTPHLFDNTSLSPFQRMRKCAHMQCFHIYGLWRTRVLRSIRFQPSSSWPDLPIMTAAAYLGEFKYVQGPKFTYLSVQKSNLERAIYQDGKSVSNRFINLRDLILAAYKTSAPAGGVLIGMIAAFFVVEKYARNFPDFIFRKLREIIFK